MKALDLTGKRFGRLLALWPTQGRASGSIVWEFECDCGKRVKVGLPNLKRTKSCGCLNQYLRIQRGTKHNGVGKPEYRSWACMRDRCLNPNHGHYHYYGGRGIKICDRWSDFAKFLEDMGTRPVGTTLDRIDVNGNYEPGNCRWATHHEQQSNKRKRNA